MEELRTDDDDESMTSDESLVYISLEMVVISRTTI